MMMMTVTSKGKNPSPVYSVVESVLTQPESESQPFLGEGWRQNGVRHYKKEKKINSSIRRANLNDCPKHLTSERPQVKRNIPPITF